MSHAHRQPGKKHAYRVAGFSLIELLIVIAIILIIAGIAIPNLIRSKIAANQAAAVENMRTITTANVAYSTEYGIGYASTLAKLGPPSGGAAASATAADFIDPILAAGSKSGYQFTYVAGAVDSLGIIDTYTLNADPLVVNWTGVDHYFVDETCIIRGNSTAAAGPSDPPI